MTKTIWNKTEDTFIAGDDDQAIFKWAGADVDSFIALQDQMINLPLIQSHRIPIKVHQLAMGIINRIKHRIDKTWQPKINEGSLQRHFDIDSVDMSSGEWLVLARTRHMLKRNRRYFYIVKGYIMKLGINVVMRKIFKKLLQTGNIYDRDSF